jgi:origin recognition complex subunit 4
LTLLSTGSNSKKSLPLIVTLDSFDLYTSRPRQALLYVLLDAVQAGSYTPGLCVVGMTSRLDTTDLLEKRVRSRFGGRTINVWPEDVWTDVLEQTLMAGLCDDTSREGKLYDGAWRREVKAICTNKEVLGMLDDWKSVSNVVKTLFKTIVSAILPECNNVEVAHSLPFSTQSLHLCQLLHHRFSPPFSRINTHSQSYPPTLSYPT